MGRMTGPNRTLQSSSALSQIIVKKAFVSPHTFLPLIGTSQVKGCKILNDFCNMVQTDRTSSIELSCSFLVIGSVALDIIDMLF